MNRLWTVCLAVVVGLVSFSSLRADESCLEKGESCGAFYVTKVAGADEDGVEVGKKLCYRCKFQSRPMVLVFSRTDNEQVGKLAKKLDEALVKYEDKQLRALVSMLGKDAAALEAAGKKFAAANSLKHVPVAVPEDGEKGPVSYKIPADAGVTVVIAKEGEVIANHVFAADKVDIDAVLKDVEKLVN